MRQVSRVCVFFPLSQCVFRQNCIHQRIWQVEPLKKNTKIKKKKKEKDPNSDILAFHQIPLKREKNPP